MPSGGQTTGPTDDVSQSIHAGENATVFRSSGNDSLVNDMDLTTVSGVARVNATTKFIDDDDIIHANESHNMSVNDLWNKMNDTQSTPQNLMDFFNKPFSLISDSFKTTDTYLTITKKLMPFDFLTDPTAEMWLDKFRGFTGARFDMRFRLVINANKFQQGRYIMGWVPLNGTSADPNKVNWFVNAHLATLCQRTQVPHVEIDINTETSAELVIPFSSVQNFFSFSNGLYVVNPAQQLGMLAIYPYIPLVSPTGSTVVPYRVYVSFENVRLFGAATAQSGIGVSENAMKMSGPISGVARNFAAGFSEFAKIPLLSSYAKSAQWVADRTARVASIFGFVKPMAGDNIQKIAMMNNSGHSNVDGSSDARSLSLLQKPCTVSLDGISGYDFDDMDFSNIIRRYAYFIGAPWSTGDAADALLLSIPITPSKILNVGGTISYPPISFVAKMFVYWRGSIKIKIKLPKTVFHSGRLAFYFTPIGSGAASVNQWYFNRQIVDIREHNEIEIIIPYMSVDPWTAYASSIGELRMVVVDPLVAPSSVSTTIGTVIEIAAGDDMEFAVYQPYEATPQTLTPQSGLGGAGEDKCVCFTIGNSQVDAHPTLFAQTTIGDKVSSFRTLLKRFSSVYPSSRAGTVQANFTNVNVVVDQIPITPVIAADTWRCDTVGLVASCYGLWTGGVRIKDVLSLGLALTPGNAITSNMGSASLNPFVPANNPKIINGSNTPNGNSKVNQMVLQQVFNNNTIVVEVPQYTKTIARSVLDCMSDQGLAATSYINNVNSMTTSGVVFQLPIGLGAPVANASTDAHNIFRALADDGSFHLFISVPPLVGSSAGGNGMFY